MILHIYIPSTNILPRISSSRIILSIKLKMIFKMPKLAWKSCPGKCRPYRPGVTVTPPEYNTQKITGTRGYGRSLRYLVCIRGLSSSFFFPFFLDMYVYPRREKKELSERVECYYIRNIAGYIYIWNGWFEISVGSNGVDAGDALLLSFSPGTQHRRFVISPEKNKKIAWKKSGKRGAVSRSRPMAGELDGGDVTRLAQWPPGSPRLLGGARPWGANPAHGGWVATGAGLPPCPAAPPTSASEVAVGIVGRLLEPSRPVSAMHNAWESHVRHRLPSFFGFPGKFEFKAKNKTKISVPESNFFFCPVPLPPSSGERCVVWFVRPAWVWFPCCASGARLQSCAG